MTSAAVPSTLKLVPSTFQTSAPVRGSSGLVLVCVGGFFPHPLTKKAAARPVRKYVFILCRLTIQLTDGGHRRRSNYHLALPGRHSVQRKVRHSSCLSVSTSAARCRVCLPNLPAKRNTALAPRLSCLPVAQKPRR